jgi:hypothetical protein
VKFWACAAVGIQTASKINKAAEAPISSRRFEDQEIKFSFAGVYSSKQTAESSDLNRKV